VTLGIFGVKVVFELL